MQRSAMFLPPPKASRVPLALVILAFGTIAVSSAQGPARHLDKDHRWYQSEEAERIAAQILSWQSPLGGWPKNVDTTAVREAGDSGGIRPTFDNRATVDELRFLARAYRATNKTAYREAFLRGLDYILQAQYPSGGWPQRYPPGDSYPRHITFNDNAMTRLMELVREVATSERYAFLDSRRRQAAQDAFDRGVECILRCQIEAGGKPTAWCAQHDEKTFEPRPARSYELVSLSGAESVGIVRLLMSLDDPSPEVVRAVESAVQWFESVRLDGVRVERRPVPESPRGFDKVVVEDPGASPLWARFYEIDSNRPIFCDRDGVPEDRLAKIGYERRTGYAWYGSWPRRLLAEEYPAWRRKWQLD